ncbi:LacI family DNA-binding transcriptional regulator [Paenibacillus thalictri]|uniref:LacI family transcriptional regulator n=1 Tax=Paenibacillus thalictri TaxID=2527873 RepID=A0A4Q9DHR1_9BACL|nr:LacI family DNA-binding transcriptional regulator [Paenibacillus thalictri]TBL69897.1 LacI family transcriptional regulator [Paenibacillus thalictri]
MANHAGVGIGTVSRAINGSAGISAKTKRKIFESIEQLGYSPNQIARSMRSNKYKSIGFFVDISNVAFALIAKGIQSELDNSSYTLSLCDIGTSDVAGKITSFLESRKFDGIILSTPTENDDDLQKLFSKLNVPIVTLDRDVPGLVAGVVTDYFSSVKKATEYLLTLGHRGIALVGGTGKIRPTKVSIEAYKEAFREQGLAFDEGLILEGQFTNESGKMLMLNLLPKIKSGKVSAILSLNNQMFHGILESIRENQLEYPRDISIITVEDNELTKLLSPAITVIRRPLVTIGQSISRILIKYMEEPELYGKMPSAVVPTEFIVRDSCSLCK